jgi:hypothetical protein
MSGVTFPHLSAMPSNLSMTLFITRYHLSFPPHQPFSPSSSHPSFSPLLIFSSLLISFFMSFSLIKKVVCRGSTHTCLRCHSKRWPQGKIRSMISQVVLCIYLCCIYYFFFYFNIAQLMYPFNVLYDITGTVFVYCRETRAILLFIER